MKNPRNPLVADISDRWKIGRKDRHGPPQCPFFILKNAGNCRCLLYEKLALRLYKQVSHIFFFFAGDYALTRLANLHDVSN